MANETELREAVAETGATTATAAADHPETSRRRTRTAPQEPQEPQEPQVSDIINTDVLCERLHKSRGTLENWRRAGWLPYIQVGRSVMFSWSSVLEALRRQERRRE